MATERASARKPAISKPPATQTEAEQWPPPETDPKVIAAMRDEVERSMEQLRQGLGVPWEVVRRRVFGR